jgi:23S rRNA pseudouridine1911/1915/1917 synthase
MTSHESGLVKIIHEDAQMLVVDKPAGLVCHPTKNGPESSLVGRLRLYLGPDAQMHLVNRLDRETSGIVIVAKSRETARDLGAVWESRNVAKEYRAIVHGLMTQDHGLIDAAIGKDESSPVAIKSAVRPDGAPSQTEFWLERTFERLEGVFSLLRVCPLTGRKHQIRVHLSHLGHPIVGDKIYGLDEQFYLSFVLRQLTPDQRRSLILNNHALHAGRVAFQYQNYPWVFQADPEPEFDDFAASASITLARG